MIRIEHNVETGEIIEIEMSEKEIVEYNKMISLADAERKKIADELELKANEMNAAKKIVLDRLGITEDEAKLLLG